jgi:hypothetical protein
LGAAVLVKKESQADVIHTSGFHDKVIVSAGVLQNFLKAFVVVTNM